MRRVLRYALGLPTPMHTEDRRVLEHVIFPYYRSLAGVTHVLFVGVDWYTRHYPHAFFADCDYWTLDVSPAAAKFAGRQHITAPVEQLDRYFTADQFDLILCNGVYGFGLNTLAQCELAFAACHSRLRSGGHLLIGWNDQPEHRPVPFESISSLALFEPMECPPLGTHRYLTDTPYRHTYDFYRKPMSGMG